VFSALCAPKSHDRLSTLLYIPQFRVYNARKAQEGGDSSEKYFHQTESIAGIRDARFQQMMPDALLMIGLTKIDTLHSMSNESESTFAPFLCVIRKASCSDLYCNFTLRSLPPPLAKYDAMIEHY
jgi:hypothetical protein